MKSKFSRGDIDQAIRDAVYYGDGWIVLSKPKSYHFDDPAKAYLQLRAVRKNEALSRCPRCKEWVPGVSRDPICDCGSGR